MRIQKFEHSNPSGSFPLETAYALMKEAEAQPPTERGRFRAMDCHADLSDLALAHRAVGEWWYVESGFFARVLDNQQRLGILNLACRSPHFAADDQCINCGYPREDH